MEISKYKYKGNSKYDVVIDCDNYIIYEDIIVKNNLLLKKDISKKELDSLLLENLYYDCYYTAVKYLNTKMRSRKEMYHYLKKKEYSAKDINKVLDDLEKCGYLNSVVYARAYINDAINLRNDGPEKIKKDLLDNGIDSNIIDSELKVFDSEIINKKLDKIISKEIRLNKDKSSFMLYQKLVTNLVNKGYSKKDITDVFNNYEIDDKSIYESEYKKLYNKFKDKYSNGELDFKIRQKLYQKGFRNF